MNSSTVRTFNSSGDMTLLEMEGEARFISSLLEPKNDINNIKEERRIEEFNGEKNVETNESFYNLGFNEFKLNAKSNMELIKSGLEPKTLDNLKYLSQLIKFELYQTKNSSLYTEDGNEPEEEDITLNQKNNTNNIKRNLANKKMNFVKTYIKKYNMINVNFLGLKIQLNQILSINNQTGLRQNNLTLNIGAMTKTLHSANLYQYYYSGVKNISKNLLDLISNLDKKFDVFGYLINAGLHLKINFIKGIYINIINGEMYVKGYESFYLGVSADIGVNLFIVSFGAKIIGHIANGTQYILANTISTNSKTRFE